MIQEHLELPRFSSNLRAFSSISEQREDFDTNHDKKLVNKRKQLTLNQEKQLNWDDVMLKLAPSNTLQKSTKLKPLLETLRTKIAKQFLNEDFNDSSLLNDASMFLFEKFWEFRSTNSNQSNFQNLDKLMKKLREKFGQFQRNLFDQCKELMEQLFNEISNLNKQNQLNDLFSRNYVQLLDSQATSVTKYFGENIKIYSFYENKIKELRGASYESESSSEDSDYYDSDEEEEEEETKDDIQIDFNAKTVEKNYDLNLIEWTKHLSNDLCTIVYELLSQNNDINQIQNELVELLGFENIEMVEFLLSNKTSVVQAYKLYIKESEIKTTSNRSVNQSNYKSITQKPSSTQAISSQIIVHTETEKKLKKIMRKEEQRLNKKTKQETEMGDNFDHTLLRKLREEQLKEAHILQLYNQKKMNSLDPNNLVKKADQYPFVFDSLLKITQSTAFIAGAKILLPENIKRVDTNVFEEIAIPASDSFANANPANYIGTKEEICFKPLIKTNDLDEVGQIVFRGTKSLNRIQTVVFDSAYNSNENLLICAPTGAGKTNIALLTIVNQIKKNIVNGVLKKDDFKIVYIAPMKALAAEMVDNFSKRLAPLGIVVKELTGDIQLTKQEIMETQMLVATPEKWDVVTRKSLGDISLSLLVRLLIIDEVHLLHDDRGSVIETIVARTLRQVESSQQMIRIVGLSATLPNYLDVARFLNVNPKSGLFFFDSRFRPVPLAQTFIGVKALNKLKQQEQMDEVCYDKALKMVREGHQVMIFVHARNSTIKTALKLNEMAKNQGDSELFRPEQTKEFGESQRHMMRSKNKQLREIFDDGFGVHHAGMLRADRNLVERSFIAGHIRVLCCTATLAWGVNLPAHAVIIKGTELYDSKKGTFVDLSMLDVLQIFGRAGRPQYDKSGEAFIITTHDKVSLYLSLLTRQSPIESQFINSLADNLNAEVCLGSVTNVTEAIRWLTYTYLHVRMKSNPLAYGVTYRMLERDPNLDLHREELIKIAARQLDKAHMLRFDETTGHLHATDLGRTASHYYIKYDTIEITNLKLKEIMNDKEILSLISECSEFQQLKVRDEEMTELDLLHESCEMPVMGGIESTHGKVNCLIQTYIAREKVESFSLISDMAYVVQNINRISRALYEMSLKRGWALMSGRLLNICKSIEKQLWYFKSPLRQFENQLTYDILGKIEDGRLSIEKLKEMSAAELGNYLRHPKMGLKVKECLNFLPSIEIETSLHPITRTVLRVKISLTADFTWNDRIHGVSEFFWVWIEDPDHNHIYHHEFFNLQRKHVKSKETQLIVFTIPIFEPLPSQYIIRVISDRWLGVEFSHSISFKHLILPELHPPHTELLDLDPLPVSALNNPKFESLYKFSHFNPIQTQIFHCLYHSNTNCLLGAPTGSGKTIAAELAMFRVFNMGKKKVVYIAPLKALVRERMIDWKVRLEEKLGKKVVELTGDVTPDMRIVAEADVIVTTPEKWDGISRSWQTRNYVKDVALIIIDEIHLLGEDRGPVLEVIVSRTNFITHHTTNPVRVVGLSTALANARDLADWLGIKQKGLYNFKPSVRPVPLEVHIQGFPGKFYCPRMATMNKPCFQEIQMHSPSKPTLIFVSSRRQTRLTALDLISCLATDSNPKQWLHMPEAEMSAITNQIIDQNLKLTLAFGIALHHAGLNDKDRKIVEELFVNQKIQILIATSTLAWGVNFPAHLVIVKGTEYFDGKTKRYVDIPITDVLQMMGRAGRPQFDDQGTAVIMVHDVKKHFYKKFLYEPFPVESNLLKVLSDHLNAEIVAATITSKQEAMDYLTWTYFFRRLLVNPSYYELESLENTPVNKYLSFLIQRSLTELENSFCVTVADDGQLQATEWGRIASFYYLSHLTVKMFKETLSNDVDIELMLDILSMVQEFEEFPVRHNEDKLNGELSTHVPLKVNSYALDSPHTKVNLLLQAHFSRVSLPTSDYITDTKSVLDQCLRVLQSILDICAYQGWLTASFSVISLMQMACQGLWLHDCDLLALPYIETDHLDRFYNHKFRIDCLPRLIEYLDRTNCESGLEEIVGDLLDRNQLRDIYQVVNMLPKIDLRMTISGSLPKSDMKTMSLDALNENRFYDLYEDEDYVINLDITRINKGKRQQNMKAYAPKYPKAKDENWIIILGSNTKNELSNDLCGLKRVNNFKIRQNVNISFKSPKLTDLQEGSNQFDLTLFFMSDVYIGLDQQFEFKFKINKKSS